MEIINKSLSGQTDPTLLREEDYFSEDDVFDDVSGIENIVANEEVIGANNEGLSGAVPDTESQPFEEVTAIGMVRDQYHRWGQIPGTVWPLIYTTDLLPEFNGLSFDINDPTLTFDKLTLGDRKELFAIISKHLKGWFGHQFPPQCVIQVFAAFMQKYQHLRENRNLGHESLIHLFNSYTAKERHMNRMGGGALPSNVIRRQPPPKPYQKNPQNKPSVRGITKSRAPKPIVSDPIIRDFGSEYYSPQNVDLCGFLTLDPIVGPITDQKLVSLHININFNDFNDFVYNLKADKKFKLVLSRDPYNFKISSNQSLFDLFKRNGSDLCDRLAEIPDYKTGFFDKYFPDNYSKERSKRKYIHNLNNHFI